jgi:hypothetical protein
VSAQHQSPLNKKSVAFEENRRAAERKKNQEAKNTAFSPKKAIWSATQQHPIPAHT